MADRKAKTSSRGKTPAKSSAKKSMMSKPDSASQQASGENASRLIDERIHSLGDWRGETLAEVRRLIHEAVPDVLEEWKWMGTPVWSHEGIICTGETYKQVVKLTFARGASIDDPKSLFNSSLEGNTRRAIDIREGESLPAKAFKDLIRSAMEANHQARAPKAKRSVTSDGKTKTVASDAKRVNSKKKAGEVVLLSGGNPQIAKGEGDVPVQRYLAAIPGWKQEIGKRLDELIVRHVPSVQKAVKWNSPFYGVEGKGWFVSFHVFARYLKVTFFKGQSLRPIPPGGTERSGDARWIDIHEDDFDEAQMAKWIKQAAKIPGWMAS